jgi:SAM-dependent methyltransferase
MSSPTSPFETFLAKYGIYRHAFSRLVSLDATVGLGARTVVEVHGDSLGAVAEPILRCAEQHFGPDFLEKYVERAAGLRLLQERYQAAPSELTIGDPSVQVSRESYDVALLLSLIYSNHRFEMLKALKAFLRDLLEDTGTIAAVGIGTGYELFVLEQFLPRWTIEGYERDPEALSGAAKLLEYFTPASRVRLKQELPLRAPKGSQCRFDAMVLFELLEHLPDPLEALKAVRCYLEPSGLAFITMAINIAQEDHVYRYENVQRCREQLHDAQLTVVREWLAPVAFHPAALRRRENMSRGNYAAVVRP